MMQPSWGSIIGGLVLLIQSASGLLRFSCSQLVVERLDPLVNPGITPSPHLHQIIGGNTFRADMTPESVPDIPSIATCTTCTFAEDFSNYWTAVMYFRARNGTFKRIPQKPNVGFESAKGGMTVYYIPTLQNSAKVTAFKPGFRMIVGDPMNRNASSVPRQLTYTCLQDPMTRTGETKDMPTKPCPAGIMANVRFPTCWNGVDLDPPDHSSHVAYPTSGTFESGGPCPATHPVKIPQLFFEVIWDTTAFNNKADWPADGSQPFVWSNGDETGYGNHGDYVFGWKGDALQKAMDSNCVSCPELKSQSIQQGNQCSVKATVDEQLDGWLKELPGDMEITR
ncbi:hypothetical protein BKA67DRAFT_642260 [Truncatella angustata]|uniref:DUF1996 domain-containing protein n=1 Tax=Truncatella angustata TaxID=152316 RepID=A0A9P8UZK9_9PEZI|nr:uncharacterized protein BKA67DRAFT_642260 [Truncatella angustata]KAH6661287.1 hypothetical protein BKA67DRAFT_642260 [Truncatella angustata]